jgi:hypothetical protein
MTENKDEILVSWILSSDQRGYGKCEDRKLIRDWFDQVQSTIISMIQYGTALEGIYNFDEIGFVLGLVATAKVITGADLYGKPFLVQPGNREWVTSIECISSKGWALPPSTVPGRPVMEL